MRALSRPLHPGPSATPPTGAGIGAAAGAPPEQGSRGAEFIHFAPGVPFSPFTVFGKGVQVRVARSHRVFFCCAPGSS
jgi:hypothetical protein